MSGMNNRDNFNGHKDSAKHQHLAHVALNVVEHVLQDHSDVCQQKNFDDGIQQPD